MPCLSMARRGPIYSPWIQLPQLRAPFLRLMGAKIGKGTIVHNVRFFNLYRGGFSSHRGKRSSSFLENGGQRSDHMILFLVCEPWIQGQADEAVRGLFRDRKIQVFRSQKTLGIRGSV